MPRFLIEFGVRLALLVSTCVVIEGGNSSIQALIQIRKIWIGENDSRAISLSWCGNERSIPPE